MQALSSRMHLPCAALPPPTLGLGNPRYLWDVWLMSRREVRFIDVGTRLIVLDCAWFDPGLNVYVSAVVLFELPVSNAVTAQLIVRRAGISWMSAVKQKPFARETSSVKFMFLCLHVSPHN